MPVTKTQRKRELFRLASTEHASLLHPGMTSSAARSFNAQIEASEDLSRVRAGLSRRDRVKLRNIVKAIELKVKATLEEGKLSQSEYSEFISRVSALYQKIREVGKTRQKRFEQVRLTEANHEKLLAEAKEPFSVIPGSVWAHDGFEWQVAIVDGRVAWRLIAPVKFEVITRRELYAEATMANATVEPAASASITS